MSCDMQTEIPKKNKKESWSLEKELCNATRCSKLCEALYVLGLLSNRESRFQIIGGEWIRGGAETFLNKFELSSQEKSDLTCIIKACATFTPGVDVESVLATWMQRRRILAESGIKTPRLYSSGSGIVIEEFIPYELSTILKSVPKIQYELLADLVTYAATLNRLGFNPVDPFKDLRSHGTDFVVVDFGADLGPPGIVSEPKPNMFQKLLRYILAQGLSLESLDYARLYRLYIP